MVDDRWDSRGEDGAAMEVRIHLSKGHVLSIEIILTLTSDVHNFVGRLVIFHRTVNFGEEMSNHVRKISRS